MENMEQRQQKPTNGEGQRSRSFGELLSGLSSELLSLVREEMRFAKVEMTQKAYYAGKDVAFLAVGGAILFAGYLAILAACIILLSKVIPLWLSALAIGVAVAVTGAILALAGMARLKRHSLAPQETIQTLKEDTEWMKRQVS